MSGTSNIWIWTVYTALDYHEGIVGLGMCGHGYHTPQREGPFGGATSAQDTLNASMLMLLIKLSIGIRPILKACTKWDIYWTNLAHPNHL